MVLQLTQEKRKKIRQERRKVAEAGIRFRTLAGADITTAVVGAYVVRFNDQTLAYSLSAQ